MQAPVPPKYRLAITPRSSVLGLMYFDGDGDTPLNVKDGVVSEVDAYPYLTSPEAWTTTFVDSDAHCLSYEIPGLDYCYRVNLEDGENALRSKGLEAVLRWVHFELDNQGHAHWPSLKVDGDCLVDSDPAAFFDRLAAIQACAPELRSAGVYQSRGGVHFVWPLITPIPSSRANTFLKAFYTHLIQCGVADQGMVFDASCAQWTRSMRMPHAKRDGYILKLWSDFSSMQPLRWQAPITPPSLKTHTTIPLPHYTDTILEDDPQYSVMKAYALTILENHVSILLTMDPKTGRNNRLVGAAGDIRQIHSIGLLSDEEAEEWRQKFIWVAENAKSYPIHESSVAITQGLTRTSRNETASRIVEYGRKCGDIAYLTKAFAEDDFDHVLRRMLSKSARPLLITPPNDTAGPIDTLLELRENAKDDTTEYDGAFSTANKCKDMLRQRVRQQDPEADQEWIRVLDVMPDKLNQKNELVGKGGIKPSRSNMVLALRNDPYWKDKIYWNEMESDISLTATPNWPSYITNATPEAKSLRWTANDYSRLREWFKCWEYSFECKDEKDIEKAVIMAAQTDSRHPVRDYLLKTCLPKWQADGVNRLDRVMTDFFNVKHTTLTSDMGRCWFIAAVARALRPGCEVHSVLVLDGPEGFGKSSSMKALVPCNTWVNDTPLIIGDKDSYQTLQGVWIVELPEIDGLRGRLLNQMKAFISSPVDRYRASYDAKARPYPRQCILFASTNEKRFLADGHDHRRWWTVRVEAEIDRERIKEFRDLLWGEAVARFLSGESYWFERDKIDSLKAAHEGRVFIDPWKTIIQGSLEGLHYRDLTKRGYITTEEILTNILEFAKKDLKGTEANRVSDIMDSLGWFNGRIDAGDGHKGWKWLDPSVYADKDGVKKS